MTTVGVDFDGVIHWYRRGWQDGSIYDEPAPGAWDGLRALLNAGHAVFIHTSRDSLAVAAWMDENAPDDLPQCVTDPADNAAKSRFWNAPERILVTDRKLPALAYIDDRAYRHTTWRSTLDELRAENLL